MDRRSELAEGALTHVLADGLIGLSLRPLAAKLGTSDRMLIYHFGSKEKLIAEVVALADGRIAESFGPPDAPVLTAGDLVRYAWGVLNKADASGAMRLYLEMCVLSARDPAHWSAAQEELREPWLVMLRSGLTEVGVAPERVAVQADLVLDTLDGLLLHRLVSRDPARSDAAAAAFAELLDQPTPAAGPDGPGPSHPRTDGGGGQP